MNGVTAFAIYQIGQEFLAAESVPLKGFPNDQVSLDQMLDIIGLIPERPIITQ